MAVDRRFVPIMQTLDPEILDNPKRLSFWVKLLLRKSHKADTINVRGVSVAIAPHHVRGSHRKLQKILGLSKGAYERQVAWFKARGYLRVMSTHGRGGETVLIIPDSLALRHSLSWTGAIKCDVCADNQREKKNTTEIARFEVGHKPGQRPGHLDAEINALNYKTIQFFEASTRGIERGANRGGYLRLKNRERISKQAGFAPTSDKIYNVSQVFVKSQFYIKIVEKNAPDTEMISVVWKPDVERTFEERRLLDGALLKLSNGHLDRVNREHSYEKKLEELFAARRLREKYGLEVTQKCFWCVQRFGRLDDGGAETLIYAYIESKIEQVTLEMRRIELFIHAQRKRLHIETAMTELIELRDELGDAERAAFEGAFPSESERLAQILLLRESNPDQFQNMPAGGQAERARAVEIWNRSNSMAAKAVLSLGHEVQGDAKNAATGF